MCVVRDGLASGCARVYVILSAVIPHRRVWTLLSDQQMSRLKRHFIHTRARFNIPRGQLPGNRCPRSVLFCRGIARSARQH